MNGTGKVPMERTMARSLKVIVAGGVSFAQKPRSAVGIEPSLVILSDPRLQLEFFQFKKLQQFTLLTIDTKGFEQDFNKLRHFSITLFPVFRHPSRILNWCPFS